MKPFDHLIRLLVLILLVGASLPGADAFAQTLKGANWLRVDHDYNNVPSTDPRRVKWNLEIAQDAPTMVSWGANYATLNTNYNIKTLMRIGFYSSPTPSEVSALHSASFSCPQINTLMSSLDAEAAAVPAGTLAAVGGFILGNEPNLPSEWGLNGRGYGRVHNCYMARWNAGTLGTKKLLAAGPGGCFDGSCPTFYTDMFAAMGSTIDGFAIHAYGGTAASFGQDFRSQITLINGAANTVVRGKPVWITEFNAGAVEGQPLPVAPTEAYFSGVLTQVRDFNAGNSNQIKAVMYFVDSPSPWDRWGHMCHPAVASPPTTGWWRTSLCFNGNWRSYWLNSKPNVDLPPRNATVTLSSIPQFMMPGQIRRFIATAVNTGAETWLGSGASNWFRLGATGANGFTFSAFPQCGGYSNNTLDARVYTCNSVATNASNAYQVDARAPTSGSSATFHVRMVRDGIEWFGTSPSRAVSLGQAFCGTAVTQCILNARPDILPFYQGNGWNTACWNRDAIVNNWCGIDPAGCNALKTGACASFNNSCRCSGGIHLGGATIDTNGTFCGYEVCGTNRRTYSCGSGNNWVDINRACN